MQSGIFFMINSGFTGKKAPANFLLNFLLGIHYR